MLNLAVFGLLRFLSSSLDFELAQLVSSTPIEELSASGSEQRRGCPDSEDPIRQQQTGARLAALHVSRGFSDAH